MKNKAFYDKVGLLEEAQRYKTSRKFLEFLYDSFQDSEKLFSIGQGPRLLTISSTLPNEFHGLDINQGSIDRAKQFIETWSEYRNDEPFKTEFDFLVGKGLLPNFDNCNFYLGSISTGFPGLLSESLDGMLASELFLHLTEQETGDIMKIAKKNLTNRGKFIFTAYTTCHPLSLDKEFVILGEMAGMKKSDFIYEGIIDIKKLSGALSNKDFSEETKRKYWMDLEQVRVFSETELEKLAQDYGLKIVSKEAIKGGMFSFAHRAVYALSN